MATKVHILPEQVTNKIAAGEVVERPASVIKELVENALDAGGTDITVEIESGGRKLIRVTDNGCGMSREDALLALERHATSKIASDADLFTLSTLGFRGEALPSIASVSRLLLSTRERGKIEGTEIYAEGGRIRDVKACGMADGTVIEVRNLFFNTPARLKFMKTIETETGHVGELLTRMALSRPGIRFTWIDNGKTVFRLLPGELSARASSLLGKNISADLVPFQYQSEDLHLHGLISRPECSRSTAGNLYTYINGRFIRDKVVQHAILQAYRNVLERGRYPVLVLFIDLSTGEVDVNVHPTKHEVRFRNQRAVHDAILSALEAELASAPWQVRSAARIMAPPAPPLHPAPVRVAEVQEALAAYGATLPQQIMMSSPRSYPSPPVPPSSEKEQYEAAAGPAAAATGYYAEMDVLGQFNAAYILCQRGTDLVLVDQHAAHERVAFEKLKRQYHDQGVENQGLLFPETLELSFTETAALREQGEEIARLGFELEPFGGSAWLLKGVPHVLAGAEYVRVLRDILADFAILGKSRAVSDRLEEMFVRIACHSVVRGRRFLTREEIASLFAEMDRSSFAANCPHGRPVSRTISLVEIEKMFKRA